MPRAIFVAREAPQGVLAAFSERGVAPEGTPSPTEHLARRLADEVGIPDIPIVRATQVHGRRVVEIESRPHPGEVADAGECDALLTHLSGVALVVQTADCVPVLLAAPDAVGAIHAGWRGAVADVVGAAAATFLRLTREPESVRAWIGPAIRSCCYEVGGDVAAQFAGDFVRASGDGRYRLDLPAAVRSRLVSAGVPPERIVTNS
ncbi:MAG TPA: polyphenol oxidase family protein, partial [Thermoanaerobaculia bacterium]|nr:polyphenol oxidase family protein [Thermoanaerobaculia bacterium]